MSESTSPALPNLPLPQVLSAISSIPRWEILRELLPGRALPVCEIAHRLGMSESSISKHFAVLLASGVVRREYGFYAVDPRFLVPGERSMDFGCVVIRFDRPA